MIGRRTVQGFTRFHEGLRRHFGWSHIIDGSRVHFKLVTGFQTKPWRSLDLVDARFRRQQGPEKVKTPHAVHPIARQSCMTSSDLTVPAGTLLRPSAGSFEDSSPVAYCSVPHQPFHPSLESTHASKGTGLAFAAAGLQVLPVSRPSPEHAESVLRRDRVPMEGPWA